MAVEGLVPALWLVVVFAMTTNGLVPAWWLVVFATTTDWLVPAWSLVVVFATTTDGLVPAWWLVGVVAMTTDWLVPAVVVDCGLDALTSVESQAKDVLTVVGSSV